MIAARHLKVAFGIGKRADFGVLHPGPIDPERNLILALARRRTRVTTNARRIVDYESVVGHRSANDGGETAVLVCAHCDRDSLGRRQVQGVHDRDEVAHRASNPEAGVVRFLFTNRG